MKIKGTNLMVDFESLDTKPGAVLLSAGLVLFNEEGIIKKGYSEFNVQKQIDSGRTVSKRTAEWWKNTNPKEFNRLMSCGMKDLNDWKKRTTKSLWAKVPGKVWSRGAMDFLICQEIFGEKLFPYHKARDVRTLDEFAGKPKANSHNALQDCLDQIAHLRKAFAMVEGK